MISARAVLLLLACAVSGHAQSGARGALTGSVLDAMHEPIALSRVEVRLRSSGESLGAGTTDGSGRFSVARLPAGAAVVVRASAPAHTCVETVADVPATSDVADLALTLCDAGTITGTVVDAAGVAVAGACVWAEPRLGQRTPAPSVARTDAEGRFALRHVPLGPVALWAFDAGLGSAATRLHLRDAAEHRIVLRKQQPTLLAIEVLDSAAARIAATAHVRPVPEPGAAQGWLPEALSVVQLDGRGEGTIRGLPPGRYAVRCTSPGRRIEPAEECIAFDAGGSATLSFSAVRPRPVRVTGTLRDERGAPLPGRRIALGPSIQADAVQTETGAGGRFTATIETWLRTPVFARALDADLTLLATWGLHTGATAAHADLTLDLTACPPRPLAGQVVDTAGNPVCGARVQLCERWSLDGGLRVTTTAADGRFSFHLPRSSGTVSLHVDSSHGVVTEDGVDLAGALGPAPVTLHLARPAEAWGTILGADGRPVPGACVQLWAQGAVWLPSAQRLDLETFTDRRGRYRFVRLPARSGRVTVSDGDRRAEGELDLTSGDRQRLDLTLR